MESVTRAVFRKNKKTKRIIVVVTVNRGELRLSIINRSRLIMNRVDFNYRIDYLWVTSNHKWVDKKKIIRSVKKQTKHNISNHQWHDVTIYLFSHYEFTKFFIINPGLNRELKTLTLTSSKTDAKQLDCTFNLSTILQKWFYSVSNIINTWSKEGFGYTHIHFYHLQPQRKKEETNGTITKKNKTDPKAT